MLTIFSFVVLVAPGCGYYRVNSPLSKDRSNDVHAYSYVNLDTLEYLADPHAKERTTFILVALSGGGVRAAALAYGVLEDMHHTPIGHSTLLDQVDIISSVSGGSFAAAYLGLYGRDKFFKNFRHDVLERKLVWDLFLKAAAPWNWPEMLLYGRSDLAEKLYKQQQIFGVHTFADMPADAPSSS
jgi:NTE family protein